MPILRYLPVILDGMLLLFEMAYLEIFLSWYSRLSEYVNQKRGILCTEVTGTFNHHPYPIKKQLGTLRTSS